MTATKKTVTLHIDGGHTRLVVTTLAALELVDRLRAAVDEVEGRDTEVRDSAHLREVPR